MVEAGHSLLSALTAGLIATTVELIAVIGYYFLFGILLYLLERMTLTLYQRTVGWNGVLWTAWLGTPIHELSHLLMCKIFCHKVIAVSFFSPDKASGTLGYVNHSYNKRNPYQAAGNLFIGAAPLIFGACVIYFVCVLLVPSSTTELLFPKPTQNFTSVSSAPLPFFVKIGADLARGITTFFTLLTPANLIRPRFLLFLYISFCISSHIAPSPADMKSIGKGTIVVFILLWIWNIGVAPFGLPDPAHVTANARFSTLGVGVFGFAVTISAVHFLLSFIVFNTVSMVKGNGFVSPI